MLQDALGTCPSNQTAWPLSPGCCKGISSKDQSGAAALWLHKSCASGSPNSIRVTLGSNSPRGTSGLLLGIQTCDSKNQNSLKIAFQYFHLSPLHASSVAGGLEGELSPLVGHLPVSSMPPSVFPISPVPRFWSCVWPQHVIAYHWMPISSRPAHGGTQPHPVPQLSFPALPAKGSQGRP